MKKKDNRNKNQIKFEMMKLNVFIQYLLYSKDLFIHTERKLSIRDALPWFY